MTLVTRKKLAVLDPTAAILFIASIGAAIRETSATQPQPRPTRAGAMAVKVGSRRRRSSATSVAQKA